MGLWLRYQRITEECMKSILVASKDRMTHKTIRSSFRSEYNVDVAPSEESCLDMFKKKRYEFLFIDAEFLQSGSTSTNGHANYRVALQPFWHVFPNAEIVVMSSQEKIRDAVMAVKAGASNYITYPIDMDELKYVTESLYESMIMQSELDYLRDKFWQSNSLEVVKTNSAAMRKVFEKVRSVAPTKSTVLLTGETGTGKGLLAKLVHHHSNRAEAQFITVHCGAIPDSLLESELFGHEKGAFTGADRRKLGKFEIAQKGTIFLDEIGTITPSAQIKLLQVLQDKTFQRVGGEVSIEADVRIIVATNANLKKMSADGLFRRDLFYRLSVFPIEIPPLVERIEDIPHLAELFLRKLNRLYSKEIHDIDPRVMEAFAQYSWPGNIRELENLMERAYILESSSVLTPESFPRELFTPEVSNLDPFSVISLPLSEMRRQTVDAVERSYLHRLLAFHKGHIQKSATIAGISTRQLHKLLTKYGINKQDFKSLPTSSNISEL
jgi:DNA-binding NtrC family response regulator